MKLKYKLVASTNGLWRVRASGNRVFTQTFATEREATEYSLLMEGGDILNKLDDIQKRMESLPGFIHPSDPHGWRA